MAKDPVSGWDKLSALATLTQAIVVIISISYIKTQMDLQTEQLKLQTQQIQQQTDLARAENIRALAAASISMNFEEVKSSELTRLSLEGTRGFDPTIRIAKDEVKKEQYRGLLAAWMIFYENIYYQNSQGLIDPEMYAAWHRDLEDFIEENRLKDSWGAMKESYHESFRNHIDQLLNQPTDKNPQ